MQAADYSPSNVVLLMKTQSMQTAFFFLSVIVLAYVFPSMNTANAHGNTPGSLQNVEIPMTPGLLDGDTPIVIDQKSAIQLGKALFWDINVGSDGMACASCHFHAGVDARSKNQLSPGRNLKSGVLPAFDATPSGGKGPNYTLKISDFPLYRLSDPMNKDSTVLFNSDDIVSSAGVFLADYVEQGAQDDHNDVCNSKTDPTFHLGSKNVRQVQTRQAPSVINAAFNFRNFWDGRANNLFNGVSPFGARDLDARIWVADPATGHASKQILRLENASLASQAVAPPLSNAEMSCDHRTMPEIARKILTRRPLDNQEIHPEDSVLAEMRDVSGKGLDTSYESLIKSAFAPRYWSGTGEFGAPSATGSVPYNQMEANFSLFFGLALQLYQQTLVSDQTPFDTPRQAGFPAMPVGLNKKQQRGLTVFLNAHCGECHKGPTFSAAAHPAVYTASTSFSSLRLVNRKTINGSFTGYGVAQALIDEGYFNTSVAPTERDPGVGGVDPFGNPLSFSKQYMQRLVTGKAMVDPVVVNSCDLDNAFFQDFLNRELIDDDSVVGSCGSRSLYAKIPKTNVLVAEQKKRNEGRAMVAVNGAFKVPSLRNIELTGPYMHNGSLLTLEQVVDFYFRGGNFNNDHHFATLVFPQSISRGEKSDLVAFLRSLTDERVRWERAPFDHPAITIPNGHKNMADMQNPLQAQDQFLNIPAVGKKGRDATLGPIKSYQRYLKP